MDEQFQNVAHSIIDKFLDKVSETCRMPKDTLWALWREMFTFPVVKEVKSKSKSLTQTKLTKKAVPEKAEKKEEPVPEKAEKKEEPVSEKAEKKEEPVPEKAEKKEEPVPVSETVVDPKKSPKKKQGCQFKITRGDRAGQECGKGITKTSDSFCSSHCK